MPVVAAAGRGSLVVAGDTPRGLLRVNAPVAFAEEYLAALGMIGLMLGAIGTHVSSGFFMNWFAALPKGEEGFEYHLTAIALALVVTIRGSGWLRPFRRRETFATGC